jgi:hypothetical protein
MNSPAIPKGLKAVPGCKCGLCQQVLNNEKLQQMAQTIAKMAGEQKPDIYFGSAAR